MAITVHTSEPGALRAGDTWVWRRDDLSDFSASTWTLTYYFRNATAYFDVTASADGDAFAVSVAMATTAARPSGWYDWIAVVTDGVSRYEVGTGRLEVLANFSASAALDARTFNRRMLDYIEAALESRASADQLDLVNAALADRSLGRDKSALLTLLREFEARVQREANRAKGINPHRLVAVC